ncbi:MAG: tyrosine protein phosphatase [Proteobacteria bacterium]|nr:tyrosine protein phosphatase [Desulfobacula sp.]MBU3951073.1 tyrosine protein phosphatase [Pseudomonadota bacterium]MBU4130782.1 tyrosine protein phosphatase [Pseudomonadota bacterium]
MIDTHSHILAELDDGARDFSESLAFMETAASQGVETIFVTPHACDGVFNCIKDQILDACLNLAMALKENGCKTRVLPGAEIRVNHDLVAEYDKGSLLTLNNAGTHLLIELPAMFMTPAISRVIRQLKDRGVTPIIAHAERNPMIMTTPGIVTEFVYQGAVIQITAGSLLGDFGKFSKKAARDLVSMDQVFCLGSDIHPGRKYRMADAKKCLIKLAGRSKAFAIINENPSAILEDLGFSDTKLFMKKAY